MTARRCWPGDVPAGSDGACPRRARSRLWRVAARSGRDDTCCGGAVLLGGLTAADTSRDDIVTVSRAGSRRVGRLPTALHDSAAVAIGRLVYLFGGGTGTAQIDTIVRVDPATGAAEAIGHLPSGSSDQAAAGIDGTAYVVGGYTGTRWLNTVVAWKPGGKARIVAHLPQAVRYSAVTAVGGRLIIAG